MTTRARIFGMASWAVGLGLITSFGAACSFIQKFDGVQCNVAADCGGNMVCTANVCLASTSGSTGDSGNVSPGNDGQPWSCVGVAGWAPPSEELSPKLKLYAFDGISTLEPDTQPFTPTPGVKMRLCARRDPTCLTPLTAEVQSDATGLVEFDMPTTRDFYVEGKKDGVTPMLVVPSLPGDGTRRLNHPIYLGTLKPSDIDGLASFAGTTQDPTLAMVLTRIIDCTGNRTQVAGVTFLNEQSGPTTKLFYLADGVPSLSATSTDKDGLGGLANAPVGLLTVHGAFASNAQEIGKSTAIVRAGWITTVEIAPTSN